MLFFTGLTRNASDVAGEQIKKTSERKKELERMVEIVNEGNDILNRNDSDLTEFGKLLHESWIIKRKLTDKITTKAIDKIYERAIRSGALGGKLLGAGGGGFILFFAEPKYQQKIKEKLKTLAVK
jgi:D-glycero-alpha-D-manno-heptose-7-phosphate kinase